MRLHLILSLLFYCDIIYCQISADKEGCASPPVIPNKPFLVIWNVPSGHCLENLGDYGISTNPNASFSGKLMTIFYRCGEFPSITANGTFINGGIPQLGNLTLHLTKLRNDVKSYIKDPKYQGLAVLDFESWRPIFQANFDSLKKYQDYSIKLVKQQHPDWTDKTQIFNEAVKQFNASAKLFFLSTLKEVRSLIPGGRLGYYGFPQNPPKDDDKLFWFWENVSGMYPRIYTAVTQTRADRIHEVETVVKETLRVKAKFTSSDMLVLPYTLMHQGATYFFDEDDLDIAFKLAGDIGSSGVVIWDSSSTFRLPGECQLLRSYVKNYFGPYILKLTNFYNKCSQVQCSGHGRCVMKKYESVYQQYLYQYNRKTSCRRPLYEIDDMKKEVREKRDPSSKYDNNDYVCSCYAGWHGNKCNIPTKPYFNVY